MNRRACIAKTVYVFLSLLLSIWMGAGVCVCGNAEAYMPMNARTRLSAGESEIVLLPDLTSEYVFYAFTEGNVNVTVKTGAGELISGSLPLTVDLRAGMPVTVRFQADEAFIFEWMRASLGRTVTTPLTLTETTVSRSITRARDVHWFCFTADEAGEYGFIAALAPKNGVRAEMLALSENGALMGQTRTAEDATGVFVTLDAGQRVYLRICAPEDNVGNYVLTAQKTETPFAIAAAREALQLHAGEWTHVSVSPETPLLWESSDPEIATVTAQGVVAAQSEGACIITAYAAGGKLITIPVTVQRAEVLGVAFVHSVMNVSLGEEIYLDYTVQPAFARNAEVRFYSMDESVARVSADGLLTAVGLGRTEIGVQTVEGGFTARLAVEVHTPKPAYRALLVGIASYSDGRTRLGCVNTTQGMADALSLDRFSESDYETTMRIDLSKDELLSEIGETFSAATENDVSLIYINCHGNMSSGIAYIELADGRRMTARELECALRRVPGQVVVILDCCFSGAFIGANATPDRFAHGVVDVFSGADNSALNAFGTDKYKVLVSSSMDQNSYRVASASPAVESSMSTVFARALTEALGWDLIKDRSTALHADLDDDRQITFHEAFLYTARRCMYYLTRTPASTARQSVQVWPVGDMFVLAK